MEATQRLRDEHKAITYNRSDCSYLAEEYHAQAPSTLSVAFENIGRAWDVDYGIKGHAFDDSKVGAHGGIIPQASRFDASRLPERERRVYEAVVERYAMQFSPPMEYDESTSCSETPYGALERKTRRVTDAGFTAVFGAEEGDEAGGSPDGPFLEAGTHEGRVCGTEVVEKKTSPPKRYTEGTLITDMASVAKYVRDPELKAALKAKDDGKAGEHGGIGTTATRAGIIETLKTRGFIEVKSGKVISTEKGRAFFDAVPEEIRSADVTARWWLIQQEVAAGRADVNAVQRSVAEVFEGHRGTAYVGKTLQAAGTVVGKCPRCGADVTARGKSFSCTSNKAHKLDDGSWERYEGCGFVLFATVAGKRLTEAQAKALLAGKRPLVKGLTSKAGKKFEARLRLDSSTGKVEFEFEKGKRH